MFSLIPVDHDPFADGPAAQPADPAIAAAGTAAPQLVPVDHDPFAAAPTNALPHIIVHPKSPNAPPDNPADTDGPDDWFVPAADGYPDDWFVPARPREIRTFGSLVAFSTVWLSWRRRIHILNSRSRLEAC
jgi:hypothetical protein